MIDAAVDALDADPERAMSTVVHPADPDALDDPNRVKVVMDRRGRALYFSRSRIPYVRDAATCALPGSTSASTPTAAASCWSS